MVKAFGRGVCGFSHNLPFRINLSSSAAHLLVFPCCQVGIWRQRASGVPGPTQLLGFQGTSAGFFFFFFTGWHLSMWNRLGRGRKIESYLITLPPLWPLKRARFVWTSDRNKLDSGKCSDNWSALWLLIHWLWSHGRKNFLHQMRGQESSNVSSIMLETAFRGWWLTKTIVLGNRIAFFTLKMANWMFMPFWNLTGRFLVFKMVVNRQYLYIQDNARIF